MSTEVTINPEHQPEGPTAKPSIVSQNASMVAHARQLSRFRGRPMLLEEEPFPHWVPLRREKFEELAYPLLGGVSRSRIGDVFAMISSTATDLTRNDRYVLFGVGRHARIWDMQELAWTEDVSPDSVVWRSPYSPERTDKAIPFVMSLAGNDKALYEDIMQSLAALIMEKKPDGVIWWVGDGANGKSTLMDAVYKIFPGQLSSITVKRLTDGRDAPSLNGTLANVVKESSEGRIEDTEIYKSIGTHENFRVHKFHSQDDVEIRGNIHHIFSGNSVPTFNDKGWSARRRTFIIPFAQRFDSDPTFEERVFTEQMFGNLIWEMAKYAKRIKEQVYRYKWSAPTLAAKGEYDTDANNAEEYAKELIEQGVIGYEDYHVLRVDYENWCAENGYVPLGVTNLRKAFKSIGFERVTSGKLDKVYRLIKVEGGLQPYGMGRPGLFTVPGFTPVAIKPTEQPQLDIIEPVAPRKSILKEGNW